MRCTIFHLDLNFALEVINKFDMNEENSAKQNLLIECKTKLTNRYSIIFTLGKLCSTARSRHLLVMLRLAAA